jgi:pentatricopeptide repeat domain-containing protein 1
VRKANRGSRLRKLDGIDTVSACEKGGQGEQVLAIFEKVPDECVQLHMNIIIHNATGSACEKGRQWQRALRLLEQMLDE